LIIIITIIVVVVVIIIIVIIIIISVYCSVDMRNMATVTASKGLPCMLLVAEEECVLGFVDHCDVHRERKKGTRIFLHSF